MARTYEECLFDPNTSYEEIIERINRPSYLYKYQSFYFNDSNENIYWKDNIQGAFHLSLGCEFEDTNDCKPFIDVDKLCETVKYFFQENNVHDKDLQMIASLVRSTANEKYVKDVQSNYQCDIRIGCFTLSSDNEIMWNKYGNNSTGFCIEYSTNQNKLLRYSSLPVVYTNVPYDSFITLANSIITQLNRQLKGRSLDEDTKAMQKVYKQIIKTTYIPIFLKQTIWSFECEYRLFLLKHRNTPIGMIKAEDEMNSNFNINLKEAITAIYLGENFHLNPNCEIIKRQILEISNSMKINIFQKKLVKNKYINIKIS